MTERTTHLHPEDQTPLDVLTALGEQLGAFPKDACIPCGAVIHIGFFFDGFGRHRDQDDPSTSRYSNICRLWEAHRENADRRREKTPNQFWYRFYYSGLGTALNEDASRGLVTSALTKVALAGASAAGAKATHIVKKTTGTDRLFIDPKSTLTDGFKNGLKEFSYRPVVHAYNDLLSDIKAVPKNVRRVLRIVEGEGDRALRRGKAAGRAILYDLKKNPVKSGYDVAKHLFGDVAFDSIPWLRDNRAVAMLLGTGVNDRLASAMSQFEKAVEDTKLAMSKIQRIQVSIFGADRGGVLARALANELTKRYRHSSPTKLAFVDTQNPNRPAIEIRIKFLGLLDAVSSLVQQNELLNFVPVLNMVKQDYSDAQLSVPGTVARCVHFAAAHELRFYQRLDSLEKTRGVQYLYPGTSEDITGGAPPGTLGARTEMQRVVLRDMLNEAIAAGATLDTMEDLRIYKQRTFGKFTLANTITDGQSTYRMSELMEAYREIVPRVSRLNFSEHMQVFLRWMAVRYRAQPSHPPLPNQLETLMANQPGLLQERQDAEAAYHALRRQSPAPDGATLGKALARWESAKIQLLEATRDIALEKNRPTQCVWDRIEQEAKTMIDRDDELVGLQAAETRLKKMEQRGELAGDLNVAFRHRTIRSFMLSPEQQTLAPGVILVVASELPY
ncbi:DUF2235 domain-containing protein [Pandoraea oxalativorans]|nr:DUF2235 domain-containing protein [Pandoraea oxalativorans]